MLGTVQKTALQESAKLTILVRAKMMKKADCKQLCSPSILCTPPTLIFVEECRTATGGVPPLASKHLKNQL